MRVVFFIYWAWYLSWEAIKLIEFKAPLWVAENFMRLDFANLFFIPIGYMFVDWVMQEKKDYRFMFYCMASFMSRVAVFLMSINQHDEFTQSAYRNINAHIIYGFVFLLCICFGTRFHKRFGYI